MTENNYLYLTIINIGHPRLNTIKRNSFFENLRCGIQYNQLCKEYNYFVFKICI